MTLNFTKQELLRLLVLVEIGDWVKHAQYEGDPKDNEELQLDKKVQQKILSAAFKAKFMGLVEYDMKDKEYIETKELEDMYMPFVDEFNEEEFWTQLSDRLAQRDMVLKYGEKGMQEMDNMERAMESYDMAMVYEEVFVKDGLMNLQFQSKS